MPIINRFADLHEEIAGWRHDFHRHPELRFDVHRTAGIVARKLEAFGCDEVATGIGRTGVVGVIRGRKAGSGKVIGLRADMDALPIKEATGHAYASEAEGLMHACGHDGHSAMLLGAARYLTETRNFDGTAVMVFQPAEEGGAGAKEMIEDGLMERFGIQEIYGLHNIPGIRSGNFAVKSGAMMAATDRLTIEVDGIGGHGAFPHTTVDPVLVGSHIVTGLQSIVSRNVDPRAAAVISITIFRAGEADNVIPPSAYLKGTVRALDAATRDTLESRIRAYVAATAEAFGASVRLTYQRDYPVTMNHPAEADLAASVAEKIVGPDRLDRDPTPIMGGEDFAWMLEARPGAYIYMGNGDSAGLHHPEYDFSDDAIPYGCSYWVSLVETAMPLD
ncbi:M20 aminoacylase family protein [Rhodobium gokarnense]|uniref:Hippurate hydrolase n=1 Tax=Rhodobium gokarnense TaxID=364296 RepID=A0ABT3HDZ2_9HYPH|nr:M20 aminoacylase family protein [Rhodobium gokarnense]MCW2308619.1 hippurate hydrolase [Rhodobium gokarnense]